MRRTTGFEGEAGGVFTVTTPVLTGLFVSMVFTGDEAGEAGPEDDAEEVAGRT